MRAHTITTTITSGATRSARKRVLALVLAVSALTIPAAANASTDYSSVNAITGGSHGSSQSAAGSDVSTVSSVTGGPFERTATERGQAVGEPGKPGSTGGSPYVGRGYESVTSITGSTSGEPTFASGSPAGDGFHWADAALGAGVALALAAFGGAALLTARRRTALSPS